MDERVKITATTITIPLTIRVQIEVPSIDFDQDKIIEQLSYSFHAWMNGLRINKTELAKALGITSKKHVFLDTHITDTDQAWEIIKYGADGKRIEARTVTREDPI